MSIWDDLQHWGSDAWHWISGIPGDVSRLGQSLWRFTVSVARVLDFVISNPFLALTLALQGIAALLTGNNQAFYNANRRLVGYIYGTQVAPVDARARRMIAALQAWAFRQLRALRHWTRWQLQTLRDWAARMMAAEQQARARGDQQAEAYTRRLVTALHQALEREAASGYRMSHTERLSLLTRVLDLAAGRNPAVRAVTSRITGLILDLAAVDNPAGRLLAGFLIRRLISRLGPDKAIGNLAAALGGPLLGGGQPRDLHAVIADLSARLDAAEQQWATFMADGGPQVLQAGEGWRDITSLVTDAGLLGFAVAGVTEPGVTARALSDLIRPAGTATIDAIARTLAGR